jgi:hypothetical protein
MPRSISVQVPCPANVWTKVVEGSFWNLALKYDLTANAVFDWRWFGSGLPWFMQSTGVPGGVAQVTVPPSTYWRIEVNPRATTTVSVMTPSS